MNAYENFACNVCGSWEAKEVDCAPHYTDGQPLHVCSKCGLVYVRKRRTARQIARDWSDRLFNEPGSFTPQTYSARIPAIKARQMFVADTIDTQVTLQDKALCDIGAGEGQFLKMVRDVYGGKPYGIEPSEALCAQLTEDGFDNFCGAIEDYVEAGETKKRNFDIVTMMWTLECSSQPQGMLDAAWRILKKDGIVAVATGSRILVPFKKPLHFYLDPKPLDTHCLRFSANTLQALLISCGFLVTFVNRYIDQDWLFVLAKKSDDLDRNKWQGDSCDEVLGFFERWHRETQTYYSQYVDE